MHYIHILLARELLFLFLSSRVRQDSALDLGCDALVFAHGEHILDILPTLNTPMYVYQSQQRLRQPFHQIHPEKFIDRSSGAVWNFIPVL